VEPAFKGRALPPPPVPAPSPSLAGDRSRPQVAEDVPQGVLERLARPEGGSSPAATLGSVHVMERVPRPAYRDFVAFGHPSWPRGRLFVVGMIVEEGIAERAPGGLLAACTTSVGTPRPTAPSPRRSTAVSTAWEPVMSSTLQTHCSILTQSIRRSPRPTVSKNAVRKSLAA
jgi:hypothetical protein